MGRPTHIARSALVLTSPVAHRSFDLRTAPERRLGDPCTASGNPSARPSCWAPRRSSSSSSHVAARTSATANWHGDWGIPERRVRRSRRPAATGTSSRRVDSASGDLPGGLGDAPPSHARRDPSFWALVTSRFARCGAAGVPKLVGGERCCPRPDRWILPSRVGSTRRASAGSGPAQRRVRESRAGGSVLDRNASVGRRISRPWGGTLGSTVFSGQGAATRQWRCGAHCSRPQPVDVAAPAAAPARAARRR
jgi:hypothetical protein